MLDPDPEPEPEPEPEPDPDPEPEPEPGPEPEPEPEPEPDPDHRYALQPARKMAAVEQAAMLANLEDVYNLRLARWWCAIAFICIGISMASHVADCAFQWHVHWGALWLGACATACMLCVLRWAAGRAAVQHAAV